MNNLKNIVAIVGCIVIAIVAYNFWIGQGFFLGLTEPEPDPSGNLSAGAVSKANFMASALEIVAWLATTIVGTIVAAATGAYRYLARQIGSFTGAKIDDEPPSVASVKRPANSRMSPAMLRPLNQLLVQSVIEGDRSMTIAIAHKIHGKPYMTTKLAKPVNDTEGGES